MARVHYYLAQDLQDFRVLLSVKQEPNRQFGNTWEGINVAVQKSWMFRRPWKHGSGFKDELYVHVPYDTLSQLRRARPDIVFSYELGFRSLTSALYCKLYRKKLALCVCVSEHTEQGRGGLRHLLRRALLKLADAVTYNGPSCYRYLKRFGVPEERLCYFPYATSDLFHYTGSLVRESTVDHRLLCVGQLTERKGVMPLLDGLAEYCKSRPNQRVDIDFIGTGNLEQAMRERELPRNLHMRLLGHMPYDALSRAMEHAGILIFPTLADEWGLVVNEAMQAGMPVIGSGYAQASSTLIREGENGWLYYPDQPQQLRQKLDSLFAIDAEQLRQMRSSAQATVQHITPQRVAASALRLFARLHSP